ncbi:MAG: stage V sporulation protein AD [Massiliimalia sp.]|jgi:stage V sporulation protein AD
MSTRISRCTLRLDHSPSILSYASIVGKKEGDGPLSQYFDVICDDTSLGEETWEKAESGMQKRAVTQALEKAHLAAADLEVLFAGDLLNQCISSSYGVRDLNIPFYGLYGACSTMAEAMSLAGIFADNGLAQHAAAVTSSHFCSAERQFRQPLEYGGQRPPTAQWTVTGSGAAIISPSQNPPYMNHITTGIVTDLGIKDINNMGAAMAPAAASTIETFLKDTNTSPSDYDLILTGDLGVIGSTLLYELLGKNGIDISNVHNDCGKMIYYIEEQDVHAGGSGAGCCASVLCSYILPKIQDGTFHNVLFAATGALMSTTSFQQGESIPCIAHLLHLSHEPNR